MSTTGGLPQVPGFCVQSTVFGSSTKRGLPSRSMQEGLPVVVALTMPRWFDDQLTYNNARVPQAILAGSVLEHDELLHCGLESLGWLLREQTAPDGHRTATSLISSERCGPGLLFVCPQIDRFIDDSWTAVKVRGHARRYGAVISGVDRG